MKKPFFVLLLLALVSCVNYDDEIRDLNEEVELLKKKNIAQDLVVDELESEVSSIKQRQADDANKLTSEIRQLAKATLEEDLIWYIKNRETFKPETRLVAMFKLCSYVLPKVIAVHQTENEPMSW